MTKITLKGNPIHTIATPLALHATAPNFKLVDKDLQDRSLDEFKGKRKIIATVPSLDTDVCSKMTKHFNDFAKSHPDVIMITVSADLPFAQKRFCEAEGVQNLVILSMMRDKQFGKDYGILIADGPLAGVLARSVLVLNEKNQVLYSELVPEIAQEPDYQKAFAFLES